VPDSTCHFALNSGSAEAMSTSYARNQDFQYELLKAIFVPLSWVTSLPVRAFNILTKIESAGLVITLNFTESANPRLSGPGLLKKLISARPAS